MNYENVRAVLKQIEDHPETWDQADWHQADQHCGSKHCFFGWAQILSGKEANKDTVRKDARIFFSMGIVDANYFSAPIRTLAELKTALDDRFSNGYDKDGFNRRGFDRAGFGRDGFNWNGRGRNGLDRHGLDRDGYNQAGFNLNGFDRDGYNKYGFDQDGFDRDGFNPDGEMGTDIIL